jgi:hypothetical protein
MLEQNIPGSEHVSVPTDSVDSWSTSSRRTIFARGGEFEQCKVSKIPYRNLETNNFQDRRAEFETKVGMDQKENV